jgi:hypothetical protein
MGAGMPLAHWMPSSTGTTAQERENPMNRLAVFAALGALLVAAPSFATDAEQEEKPAVSAAAPAVKEAPVRRRTTLERWRGGPVRGSHSDSLIRQEALDKNLPIVTHTSQIAATPSF